MFVSCCAHRNILIKSCLVHGDSSGAGGSSCCGRGGHSSRLPPGRRIGSGCWGTLWGPLTPRHAQRKPQLPSSPRRASCSCGMSCSCLFSPGGLSCPCPVHVLSCLSRPRGLLIPPNFPREIFFGGRRVPAGVARPRDEATAMKDHWAPCTAMASWAPCTTMASWAPCTCHGLRSSQLRHGLQSSQLRHGLRYLFRSGGHRPVVLSVSILRGLQSAHPPSLVELLRRGTRLPGGGSYVRVLLCCVFPPLVSLFGLFPVLVRCDYWLILVQPCLSNYLWFTCVFIVLSVQFDLVWSTRYSRCFLSVSLALSCHV